ncbi:MAG: glycyl-radical enzyme activating protein [Deltaproteobacteria bacterium HGW-Deltaproteobacteria-1]|nr:MAG: glycyl-radical enzyme activating protein [Deltaproteobacteria bacterium HGW-Deltaproteobacteria-1]
MKIPFILEIKGNSLDDGPGIRSVVFYKGCPLSCVWCHNPESKKAAAEISFDAKLCIDCGVCREACPEKALGQDNCFYIDRSKCTLCYLCVDSCPSGALDRVGKAMTVNDIIEKILPDKPFFDTSGGGTTLSGGEPTLFMEFTSQLLQSLKQHNIHTLLETCGYFDLNAFMDMLYPYLDTIFFDIKIIDSIAHKKYCGRPNEKILDNFRRISEKAKKENKMLLPRLPLIPDITDTQANVRGIAAFLKSLNISEASLLAYNPLWHEKSDKIGVEDPYKKSKAMTSFEDKAVLERCKTILIEAGIEEINL